MMSYDEIDRAKFYAQKLLSEKDLYKYDRLGYCIAISRGNSILGVIFLRENNIEEAKKCLLQIVTVPNYCEKNITFYGTVLSRELPEKGERDVVIEFLKRCDKIWEEGRKERQNMPGGILTCIY